MTDPAAPSLEDPSNETPYSFEVSWAQPTITNGRLVGYTLTVASQGPSYVIPADCPPEETTPLVFNINPNQTNHEFVEGRPYHTYGITVKAATSRGFGMESDVKYITTQRTGTMVLRHFTVQKKLNLSFFCSF